MKQTVVLYPGAGVGHVVPMAELAKVFLNHGYDVTMVLIPLPFKSADFGAGVIERIAASNPSITFHVLPPIPLADFTSSGKHPFLLMLQMLHQYNENLESFLCSIPRQRLHSLVIDMFVVDPIDVATKMGIPVYTFVPSGASALVVLTQVPTLLASRQTGLKELGDTPLEFLGVPPMPASHLVKELLENPEDEMCKTMANIIKRGMNTRGVLVNTFESLESQAVQALRDPLCVSGQVLPPIYCVGPLVGNGARDGEKAERHECLAWLDAQPERSVVFLCFGSMGALPEEQLKEIAVGLDKSSQRFLWVVRTPASIDDPKRFLEQRPDPDLDALLPEEFLERTKDRGLVVKSWAPQVEVLHHPATGAFVTHCGWNSTQEGIMAGIPMLCWPLYAEQKMNKVFMTEDMGVGVEMEGYRMGFIKAEEVEAKVRLVMESTEGRELKARVAARKKEAEAALEVGGSSQAAFLQFLSDVENIGEQLGK
ncbi:UDP-glycosyltransferase 88A1-like [Phragmites australis]|uniref:UDP-glycosyltransferase 88A1-like n=1 Tax=Phragmites australis TaxID=29695 RepID=UPI002D796DAC|nr:UDP-glycosyltransferase 88A1-like [Phragmites australis]